MSPRTTTSILLAACALVWTATSARGDTIITATERDNQQVVQVNLTQNTVTTLCNTAFISPDSLLLYFQNGQASYIYSGSDSGQVRMCTPLQVSPTIIPCNLTTVGQTCDKPLANMSSQGGALQDMIMEPAAVSAAAGYTGATLLVSDDNNGIFRVDLSNTNPLTSWTRLVTLAACPNPQGLAYDGQNHLFANCGFGNTANDGIYQFNPVGGAFIQSIIGVDPTGTLDGLIFDPSFSPNGQLFATSKGANSTGAPTCSSAKCGSVYRFVIDPATTALTATNEPNAQIPTQYPTGEGPDGIITNGRGTLYIAGRGNNHIWSYDAVHGTAATQLTNVPTLDDLGIAPAQPPVLTKAFNPVAILVGGSATMTFTVTNPNATTDLLGVVVTDQSPDFPFTNINIVTATAPTGTCLTAPWNGTVAPFTSSGFTLTIPTLSANNPTCTLTLTVSGVVATASATNTAHVTSTNAGAGADASASIKVTQITYLPPSITKQFDLANNPTLPNTCVATKFTITSTDSVNTLTNVKATDTLPSGLVLCATPVPSGTCLGAPYNGTFTAGAPGFVLNIPTFAASASCTLTVYMEAATPNAYLNSVTVTSDQVPGNTATDTLTVNPPPPQPPLLTKHFSPNPVAISQVSHLSFSISNPNTSLALAGIGFSDTLPSPVVIAPTPNLVDGCTPPGTITAPANGTLITAAGISLAAGASCTFQVDVLSATAGTFPNTTSTITTTTLAATGTPATDTLRVSAPPTPDVYQVSYAAHLDIGDSAVNLTNFGTLDGRDPNGNICINVYIYDPAEEPVSCCACLVTPNGLKTLSAQKDLISNPLTRGTPTSIVIKLLASTPIGGTCDPAKPTADTLVRGMGAWRTTLHALPTSPVTYQGTENPFEVSDLSPSELSKLTTLCGYIENYGSGYGICKSCQTGVQGAVKQQ